MTEANARLDQPLVSIAIPTMNRRHDLPTSIGSILAQNYHNLEILISDNGSTDDTPEYCRDLAAQDSRVRYLRHEQNIGFMANWNYVLQQSEGKYFMWLGDDDWLEPGTIKSYVDFLESNPDYSLASGTILYWQNGSVIREEKGLSLSENKAISRSISYYRKVIDGAMVYGLCRSEAAKRIKQENGIGRDWHFVAAMASQGKLKQFDTLAYNKVLGGNSSSYKKYAQVMNVPVYWGNAPFIKIALDTVGVILHKYPVYQKLSYFTRLRTAMLSFGGVLANYYIRRYPYILGGKVLRTIGIKTPKEKKRENLQNSIRQKEFAHNKTEVF